MIFKIENLGLIKRVEVDLDKDLILFCGHNNTGKSYLAYEIYNFLSHKEGLRAYIAPAERAAINIFSKELALNKNKLLSGLLKSGENAHNMLDALREQVDRYPQPIQDNLKIAEDLLFLSRNHSEFGYLANELEQDILKGKMIISPEGEIKYRPNNAPEQSLELSQTASLVKSLANIVFYLRHLAGAGDYIIIDEPELNLHPDNQILMARFLGRLVNEGFKVIVSTHSDYIIMEMSNLIMLGSADEKTADLIKQYGYAENQLLKAERVGGLLFTESDKMPHEITITETGLEIATINQVVDNLNKSSEGIYFALFD
ncbi:MAG: AAA family ATPase [Candidatus Parabeggiatoa sp.]|nr:AAA family ATPase [Candidatus Parabeggiatoa sp.]